METVFGPKFQKGFPEVRRVCDSPCGCGDWPAKTGGKYDHMPGIDLVTETGYRVSLCLIFLLYFWIPNYNYKHL